LNDSNRVLPIPLVLSDQDAETIHRGALQRAKALKLFFHDIVMGEQRAIHQNVIPHNVIYAIFDPYDITLLRQYWKNRTLSDISFFYGPDIIRGPRGNFLVIEDNIGAIGGRLDVESVVDMFSREFIGVYRSTVSGGTTPNVDLYLAKSLWP
jgi:uncharacterized circularly permuted ATP-grasp superfamily protein